ncbi:MAG: hypothetical protein CVU79_12480, partial [Elusimicrobia bacterium HGW-Elusimicrobia-3]
MKQALLPLFWLAITGAAAVNLWFLAAGLIAWARAGRALPKAALAAAFAAAFLAGHFAFSGISNRGGYDNDHDFQYLGATFPDLRGLNRTFSGKEVSPLLLDAVGDALSGRSLAAVPLKNRALMFLAAVLLFACLRELGAGRGGAFLGFALFYFNFLSGLNARTFSTTPANVFYLCLALYAAARFEAARRDPGGLAWALSALFLVWTGRYELAPLPGALLAVSLLRPGGALRSLLAAGPRRAAALALLAACAVVCGAWFLVMIGSGEYNGPSGGELFKPAAHFSYQLWEKNVAVFSQLPLWACWLAAAAGTIALLFSALAWKDGRRLSAAAAVLAGCVYVSVIFLPQDLYPLHFMRHQLYFLLPFCALAALAWDAVWRQRAPAAELALLLLLCGGYLRANGGAAAALEAERRTNDEEWAVLSSAAAAWPRGCALAYGQDDHRRGVLDKYFPLLSGDCSVPPPACVLKYVPAHCQVFGGPEENRPRGCAGSWLPGAADGRALAEASFSHRFYTIFAREENRLPVPVSVGFYPADSGPDRALLLSGEGICELKGGTLPSAAVKFRAALAADPGCSGCALGLAGALALDGSPEA